LVASPPRLPASDGLILPGLFDVFVVVFVDIAPSSVSLFTLSLGQFKIPGIVTIMAREYRRNLLRMYKGDYRIAAVPTVPCG
jgi:hypothetical protein